MAYTLNKFILELLNNITSLECQSLIMLMPDEVVSPLDRATMQKNKQKSRVLIIQKLQEAEFIKDKDITKLIEKWDPIPNLTALTIFLRDSQVTMLVFKST